MRLTFQGVCGNGGKYFCIRRNLVYTYVRVQLIGVRSGPRVYATRTTITCERTHMHGPTDAYTVYTYHGVFIRLKI